MRRNFGCINSSTDELAGGHTVVVERPVAAAHTFPLALFFQVGNVDVFKLSVKTSIEEVHLDNLFLISNRSTRYIVNEIELTLV